MTPRGGPLSENGKVLLFCLLFPIFWIFIPIVLICMAGEGIRNAYYGWRYSRAERREAQKD